MQSGEPGGSKFEAFRAAEFDHFEVAEFGPVEAFSHFPSGSEGPPPAALLKLLKLLRGLGRCFNTTTAGSR